MTLEEAITILSQFTHPDTWICDHDDIDAIKLSIEALRRIIAERESLLAKAWMLLPGETKD